MPKTLEEFVNSYRNGSRPSVRSLLKDDREWAICHSCQKWHNLPTMAKDQAYHDFYVRHPFDSGCFVQRIGPVQMEQLLKREEVRRAKNQLRQKGWSHNSSVLEAFQSSDQSLDLTAFGIASSSTAGWCSCWIDNTTNLYSEYLSEIILANVNTATGGASEYLVMCCGMLNTSDTLPTNSAGNAVTNSSTTSALLTFLAYTANDPGFPIIKRVPYITTNKWTQAGAWPMAFAFNGWVPRFFWFPFINNAGPTINTTGTTWKYRGVYNTVA